MVSFDTGPRSIAKTGSSSHALDLSFRVRHRYVPARPLESVIPPSPGLFPYRDIEKASLLAGAPPMAHLRSVLSVSHTPNGLLLARSCRFISSCSHVWDSPFRVFPRCSSRPPRRRSIPSCRLTPLVSPKSYPFDSNSLSPAYRVLLQTAIRC